MFALICDFVMLPCFSKCVLLVFFLACAFRVSTFFTSPPELFAPVWSKWPLCAGSESNLDGMFCCRAMPFTDEQKIDCVRWFFENGATSGRRTIADVQSEFRLKYGFYGPAGVIPFPDRNSIRRWVSNYKETGSATEDLPRSGRPRTVLTDENVWSMCVSVEEKRSQGHRPRAAEFVAEGGGGISKSSVKNLLDEAGLNDYKYEKLAHPVITTEAHKKRVLAYAERELARIDGERAAQLAAGAADDPPHRNHLFMTDEARFPLDGYFHSANDHYYASENLHLKRPKESHTPWVMVWLGLSRHYVTTIHFFDGTVNQHSYGALLRSKFSAWNSDPNSYFVRRKADIIWQQDGARAHIAKSVSACF